MMRSALALLICTSLLSAASAQTAAPKPASHASGTGAVASSVSQIKIPPLHPFHPQQPKRIQLENGMIIFLQEDHELTLVDATARIRGGARDIHAAKAGMMSVYGQSWRTGGTKSQTGDQLDDFLEPRAAKVETGGGADSTHTRFYLLKGHLKSDF